MHFTNGTLLIVMGVRRCIPPNLGLASSQGDGTALELFAKPVEEVVWGSYRQLHASELF